MHKLTSRQWRLYNFYKAQGDKWTLQADTVKYLAEWYPETGDCNFHDCTARILLTNDIRAINNCPIIQKVIISSARGNKIANEEEHKKYVVSELVAVLEKLKRVKQKIRKGDLDGQYRIALGQERDIVEAFLKEEKK